MGSDSVTIQVSPLKGRQDGTGGRAILLCCFNFLLPCTLTEGAWGKLSVERREGREPWPVRALLGGALEQEVGGAAGNRKERLSGRALQGF